MESENIIGENVRRIRAARGLSQKALAERARLSRLALAKIERGETVPRVASLREVARALGVSTVDLASPVRPIGSVRFRARKRMRERNQVLAEVANWLDNYCYLEGELDDHAEFRFGALVGHRDGDPEAVAQEARRILELGDQPIHDICGLLEKCGVKVLRLPRATDAFFGLSVAASEGGPAVVINTWERISVERWIFSAVHELGHLLLHPEAYVRDEECEAKTEEKEADTFASSFLMPTESFNREWKDASGHPLHERVLKMKRIFHVSYKTVLVRLLQSGQVQKDVFQTFQVQHKRRFGKTLKKEDEPRAVSESYFDARRAQEPDRLSDADCMDDRLRRMVREAMERGIISLGRGAEMLGKSLVDMRQTASEWAA